MEPQRRCGHCRRLFVPNPRVKEQGYCRRKGCQRARRKLWQRRKMAQDPDYKANQRRSEQQWHTEHPDYWRHYRRRNPGYVLRNRLLQKERNRKRRARERIATMDALKPFSSIKSGTYYIVAEPCQEIATMDASGQKVVIIPTG